MIRALLVLCLAGSVSGDDWPNWRGPKYDGISAEKLPEPLPEKPKVAWRAKVGVGFSSVAVADGRVYTMGNADKTDTVWCLDAKTGRVVWKSSYPCALDPLYYEGGPGATPTVADGAVYTFSKKGHALRLDATTGKVRWRRDLRVEHGLKLAEWSFAGSPFVHGDRVILNAGGAGIALDRETGKTIWLSNTEPAGYSTPVPFVRNGRTELLLFGAKELVSVFPEEGDVAWRVPWKTGRDVNAADPIVRGNEVLISSTTGTALLRVGEKPEIVWNRKRNLRCYFNPGVLIGDHVYALDGTTHRPTELICLEWKTGEVVWREPGFGSGGLMAAGDMVLVFDKGTLTILPATSKGFAPLLQAKVLDGKCWTAPAFSGGRVYGRNAAGDLVCVDLATR